MNSAKPHERYELMVGPRVLDDGDSIISVAKPIQAYVEQISQGIGIHCNADDPDEIVGVTLHGVYSE